jgi:hypothetical protein
MKTLFALLVAIVLFSPAFAQKVTLPPGIRPKPPANLVAPATKPIILHTGKPITQDQVHQLLESSIQKYEAGKITSKQFANLKYYYVDPIVFNLDMMHKDGVAFAAAINPMYVDFEPGGSIFFKHGAANNLTFFVKVQPDTAYTLVMKLNPENWPEKFTFSPASGGSAPSETITVTESDIENDPVTSANYVDIVYSFVSDSTGITAIVLYSPNAEQWAFISCQLSSVSIQNQ